MQAYFVAFCKPSGLARRDRSSNCSTGQTLLNLYALTIFCEGGLAWLDCFWTCHCHYSLRGSSVFCSRFGAFCSRGVSLSRNRVFCSGRFPRVFSVTARVLFVPSNIIAAAPPPFQQTGACYANQVETAMFRCLYLVCIETAVGYTVCCIYHAMQT